MGLNYLGRKKEYLLVLKLINSETQVYFFFLEENRKVLLSNNFIILPVTKKTKKMPLVGKGSLSEGRSGLEVSHGGA